MRKTFLPFLLICLAATAPARAQWAPEANVGTLGGGAGASIALTESSSFRLGISAGNLSRNISQAGVDYHARIRLANAPILLDWHPGGGPFRLSLGVVANNDKADLDAVPSSNSTFTFNGATYTASQVGTATGTVKVNSVAPYVGMGFGNPVAHDVNWSFGADLGVMYIGKPKATLTVTCSSSISAAQCATLQSDANAEADQLNEAIAKYRWYPVIQFRIAKKF